MSGDDLVRAWKDPEDRGDAAHPAGEINLDDLSGGIALPPITAPHSFAFGTYLPCCHDSSVDRCPSVLWFWCGPWQAPTQ